MKNYFLKVAKYEFWANLTVLEYILRHPNPPEKALRLFSHIILAQRIWLERIEGKKTDLSPWELLDTSVFLELLEMNFAEITQIITQEELGQLIQYTTTTGGTYTNVMEDILTHLMHHSAYHRGQIMQLLKIENEPVPATDYIVYVRE